MTEVNPEDSCPDQDTTCGLQLNYGCCSKKKRRPLGVLQRFATTRWVLFFFCALGFAYGFVVNGMLKSVLTTIEKRFGLKSAESGLIVSIKEISSVLGILVAMSIGGRGHKPLWVGWGMVIFGCSCLIFAIPHFIAPTYTVNTAGTGGVLCLANSTKFINANLQIYLAVFYISSLMGGYGSIALYTLGLTYIDENVAQKYSSMYHSVFFAISNALGPACGYLGTGAILKVFTNIGEKVTIDDTNASWVGAWWPGFLGAGAWILVFSIPVLLFPRKLPGTEETRKNRENETYGASAEQTAVGETGEKPDRNKWKKVLDDFLVLFRNPPYILLCFANSMECGLIAGLSTFIPKYLEATFGISPTEGAMFTGVVAIGGAVVGLMAGGFIVSKAELKVQGIMKFCFTFLVLSLLCAGAFFLRCPDLDFAGATIPYHNQTVKSATNFSSPCNIQCGCNSDVYNPICGDNGVTYFSPCFAGCTETINQSYVNCSCVSKHNQTFTRAKGGVCEDKRCNNIALFLTFLFLLTVCTFMCWTPNLQIVIRIVPFTHRDLAVGVQSIFNDAIGAFSVPIIIGRLIDSACAVWSTEDGVVASCRRYFNHEMSLYLLFVVVALKSLSIISYITAFLIYTRSMKNEKSSDDITNTMDTVFDD